MTTNYSVGGVHHNAFDVDADGLYLYLAVLSSVGVPQVLKMSTSLLANATIVYNPGSGSEIGLMAGDLSSYFVWVAGALGGTNKVALTEDGGVYWTVMDEGSWSGVARPILVGPGNDLLVTTSTDLSFRQSRTEGDSVYWVERTLPGTIWALDRVDDNFDDTVVGGYWYTGDSEELVHYSPNSGLDWENVTDTLTPPGTITSLIIGH